LLTLLCLAAGCGGGGGDAHPDPEAIPIDSLDWATPTEQDDFRSTPGYDETMAWLERLEAATPHVAIHTFGESALGRPMKLAVVSKEQVPTPAAAHASGKPVVLIINGNHPGEICGKDATLILLRELLVEQKLPGVLEQVILLVVPVYNIDGHERMGNSRINQDGPEKGMGFRTTATGMDLNRDFLKLDTVEAQALMGAVIAEWDPHLVIDNHTTDGDRHQYHLAYGLDTSPRSDVGVAAWTEAVIDHAAARMEEAGRPVAPYVYPKDWKDPANGMAGGWGSARFSTGYVALRDRSSILIEAHSYLPYQTRVEATRDFLAFILEYVADDPAALTGAVAAADEQVVKDNKVVLRVKRNEEHSRPFTYRTYASERVMGEASGVPILVHSEEPISMEVQLFDRMEVDLEMEMPAGYLVPRQYPEFVEILQLHGFELQRLARATTVPVEMVRILEAEYRKEPYQGRQTADVREWAMETMEREFPAGTYWLPLDQPSPKVAAFLLEPMSPDSFFAWGFMSRIMERKEWFSDFVMEPIAQQMMQADPALAEEFEKALADDEELRGNPHGRLEFFYRKTEHADPDWRLHPVGRVMEGLPEGTALEPVE